MSATKESAEIVQKLQTIQEKCLASFTQIFQEFSEQINLEVKQFYSQVIVLVEQNLTLEVKTISLNDERASLKMISSNSNNDILAIKKTSPR